MRKNTCLCMVVLFLKVFSSGSSLSYYDIILPSYPPDGILKEPAAVNEFLQICGPGFDSSWPSYLWQNGVKTSLPFESGHVNDSYANAVNNLGVIVGGASMSMGNSTTQIWDGQQLTSLGTLGGDYSVGYAINDKNQVVGRSRVNDLNNIVHPFLWDTGQMTDLGTLGGSYGEAYAVNESTVVVGYSRNAQDDKRAFIWEQGVMTDLGTLGGNQSVALDINDPNVVVGYSEIENGYQHACLWIDGQIQDLGTLGGSQSQAFSINNDGTILGWAETHTGYRPLVVWSNSQIIRLQTLIDPDSGWELIKPYPEHTLPFFSITNNGAILGKGFINGGDFSFLMIPRERPFLNADVNSDQEVNLADFSVFSNEWLK